MHELCKRKQGFNDENLGVGQAPQRLLQEFQMPAVTACSLPWEHFHLLSSLVSGKTSVSLSSVSPSHAKREW